MEIHIPNTFDNFQQKILSNGLETKSETEYKGYLIVLRCYTFRGISAKIIKVLDCGKRKELRQEHWNFYKPIDLLNKMKNYIDNYEINLIKKL
jgi:transcriptional regulatory protein LevR